MSYVQNTWIESLQWPRPPGVFTMEAFGPTTTSKADIVASITPGNITCHCIAAYNSCSPKPACLIFRLGPVSDRKLKRIQRKVFTTLQAKLFDAWTKYRNSEKSPMERAPKDLFPLVWSSRCMNVQVLIIVCAILVLEISV